MRARPRQARPATNEEKANEQSYSEESPPRLRLHGKKSLPSSVLSPPPT
jgi:hypothetical protein